MSDALPPEVKAISWDEEWAALKARPATDEEALEEVRGALQLYFNAIPHLRRPRDDDEKPKRYEERMAHSKICVGIVPRLARAVRLLEDSLARKEET